jgi:hypothetical protein
MTKHSRPLIAFLLVLILVLLLCALVAGTISMAAPTPTIEPVLSAENADMKTSTETTNTTRVLLSLLTCVLCLGAMSPRAGVIAGGRQAAGGVVPTYLVKQDFEGAGYDNSETWTESGAGTIDEDYATSPAPLVGSQSLQLSGAAVINTYTTFAGQSTVDVYFKLHRVSGSNHRGMSLRNSSGTAVFYLIIESGGALTARAGTAGGVSTVSTTSTGTTYDVWITWTKGTGANAVASVAFSTNGVRPLSGNAYAQHTTGNAATDAARIMLGSDLSSTFHLVFDKVRVDDVTIGDNPS